MIIECHRNVAGELIYIIEGASKSYLQAIRYLQDVRNYSRVRAEKMLERAKDNYDTKGKQ